MQRLVYLATFTLVGVSTVALLVTWLLQQAGYPAPVGFGRLPALFGHPVPRALQFRLPVWLNLALLLAQASLVLYRVAQMVKTRSLAPPSSFRGPVAVVLSVAVLSVVLALVVLFASMALRAGSAVPAGMLLIPAVVVLPYAWLWVELAALRAQRAVA
jgi:hypothetical protein